MSSKPNLNGPPAEAAEIAEREVRWRAALAGAEQALAVGEAVDAERQAKALSAIAKAASDILAWKAKASEGLNLEELDDDGAAFRRELELRINRFRAEEGLDPLFEEPDAA